MKEAIEREEEWTAAYTVLIMRDEASPPNYARIKCTPAQFAESLLSPDHISTSIELQLLGRYAGVNVVVLQEHAGNWAPQRYTHRRPDELNLPLSAPLSHYPVLSPNHATVVLRA